MATPASGKSVSPLQWDLASLVDLEIAVAQEKSLDDADLKRRDRAFYKRYCEAGGPTGSRSRAFRGWVEERRNDSQKDIPTPGQKAQAWLGWIKSLGFMVTFLLDATWACQFSLKNTSLALLLRKCFAETIDRQGIAV